MVFGMRDTTEDSYFVLNVVHFNTQKEKEEGEVMHIHRNWPAAELLFDNLHHAMQYMQSRYILWNYNCPCIIIQVNVVSYARMAMIYQTMSLLMW